MDYLTRYRNGEYVQVWEELIKLGPEIRQGELYRQAEAVARETMRRVKTNLQTLVERLNTINYKFENNPLTPPGRGLKKEIKDFEREYGVLPLSLKLFYEEVGQVDFMGSHPKISEYAKLVSAGNMSQDFLSIYQKHFGEIKESGKPTQQSLNLGFQLLQELTGNAATKDSSARAHQLKAFSKDLIAGFPVMTGPTQPQVKVEKIDVYADPLVVYQDFSEFDIDPEEFEDAGLKDPVSGRYQLTLAPDPIHKANYSGGSPTYIQFPDYSIDGEIVGDGVKYGYFVSYLRECFRWGGFPGLKRLRSTAR